MSRLVIQGVSVLDSTMETGLRPGQTVILQGDRILAVGPADAPSLVARDGDTILEGTDRLLAPGLVNAHTHSQSSTLAGFGDRLSHPAFMWLTQAHTSGRTRDEIRLAVFLCAYGLMASGTTAVLDHFPGQRFSGDDLDAVLGAWAETGLRAVVGVRFFDQAFADIIPTDLPDDLAGRLDRVELLKRQPLESVAELTRDAVGRWHGYEGRIGVFPAPSNPDRCSDAALLFCAEIAATHDLGIHTHLLETARQRSIAIDRYGVGTLAHLEQLGVLSERWSCAHSIWLDDDEIALMAKRGVIAVLNPESNARLGTGLCPIPSLRRQGVRLALGTDGAGSNDNMVMHEAMRAIATAHRQDEANHERWMSARESFEIATSGGAKALRCPGLGQVAAGAPADVVLYRLDAPWWFPINDAVAQMVFAETGASVDTVIAAGQVIYSGGRPRRFDPVELRLEIEAMIQSLRRRNADLFEAAARVASQ
ncbi:Cytosine/adenosine deaminase [Arboricoccus pini]|uniref:Cytosine/adenosine deaminase n=1 Tax=Arboricoccus pini TaxID=1963835 RepID=A0A212RY21_9PROT|nr:amidohydrolase family protein [Arboricoccus pini]SNB77721.1 Cytosine/adenosine deaminase [Arboricoccus pini]